MRRAFPSACERCGQSGVALTGSFFDENLICPRCNDIERAHPDFQRAHETEVQQVQAGNYNYPGVGVPAGLVNTCRAAREQEARLQPGGRNA